MSIKWEINTGVVPDGITEYSVVEVIYKDEKQMLWGNPYHIVKNDDPALWSKTGSDFDVVFYRIIS